MNSETKVYKIESHFLGAYLAAEAAMGVIDLLPPCDLVEEIKNLIYIQHDLMTHVIEGKHYGTNNIYKFIEYTNEIKMEVRRLSDEGV